MGNGKKFPCVKESGELILFRLQDGSISISLTPVSFGWSFVMEAKTSLCNAGAGLAVTMEGELDAYHVIPCGIYGDNNIDRGKNQANFQVLQEKYKGTVVLFPVPLGIPGGSGGCSVSMMCNGGNTVGISHMSLLAGRRKTKNIHNGVFAALPGTAGVLNGL